MLARTKSLYSYLIFSLIENLILNISELKARKLQIFFISFSLPRLGGSAVTAELIAVHTLTKTYKANHLHRIERINLKFWRGASQPL